MFKLTYELRPERGDGRREATVLLLPITCTLSHALAEVAHVFARDTVRLHTLTLERLGVESNQYVVKATLVRYEREGL